MTVVKQVQIIIRTTQEESYNHTKAKDKRYFCNEFYQKNHFRRRYQEDINDISDNKMIRH